MPNDVQDLQGLPPEVSAMIARFNTAAGGCFSLVSITKGIAAETEEAGTDAARLPTSADATGYCFSLASVAL